MKTNIFFTALYAGALSIFLAASTALAQNKPIKPIATFGCQCQAWVIVECPPEGNTPNMFTTDIFMPVGTGGKTSCSEWEDGTTVDGKDIGLTDPIYCPIPGTNGAMLDTGKMTLVLWDCKQTSNLNFEYEQFLKTLEDEERLEY